MYKYFSYLLLFLALGANGQQASTMLLLDEKVQFEATNAVNSMYNFKFEDAEKTFLEMKGKYPTHPLPYFLMGLSQWWKIMPTLDIDLIPNEKLFVAYMDSSITFAEKLFDANEKNAEAAFFLSAAYGMKARLYGETGRYSKASFNGKDALDYLDKYDNNDDLGPEFLFGHALFNYYAVWIRDNYPILRPILMFFPNGNKELGIKQLKEVSYNAFYTRTEAQYFLMRIYANEENNEEKALPISRYLATTFPDNAYFQRAFARYSFTTGQWAEAEKVSYDILYKLSIGMPGFEAISGRYASFILGRIQKHKYNNNAKAKEYYNKTLAFAEQTKATKMNYYLYALADLAKIADEEKDYEAARNYYKRVEKNSSSKDEINKEAKAYLSKKKKKK